MRTAILYNFLTEASLMAGIAILLMIPIRRFLRGSLTSRVLCFGWVLTAIRLLCPLTLPNPFIAQIRSPYAQDAAIRPIAGQIKVRFSDLASSLSRKAQTVFGYGTLADGLEQLNESSYNGMLALHVMMLYVVGLTVVLAWFVFSNVRFRRRLRTNRIEPLSGEMLQAYQAICAQQKVKPLPVWYVDPLPSACLVGLFKPFIALPLTANPEDVPQILRHELCHYQRRDNLWGAVRLACCALHWFNPLVWLAASMSRVDVELACDERVVSALDEGQRKAYANVLVQSVTRRDQPGLTVLSTGMSMTGRKLKTRVRAILGCGRVQKGLALAFVLIGSMALVGAFATSESTPRLRIPSMPATNAALTRTAIPLGDAQKATEYAQSLWSNPYLREDTESLNWNVAESTGRIIVTGCRPNGEAALTCAFLPNGGIVYLCSLTNGPTESFAVDAPLYENNPEACQKLLEYSMEAVNAVMPGRVAVYPEECFVSEGIHEESGSRNLSFAFQQTDGERFPVRFSLQVEPEIKLIYLCDGLYMSDLECDLLEPGNG